MGYAEIAAIVAAVFVGFLGGLLTFKRSLRWCRHCGAALTCASCEGWRTTGRLLAPDARSGDRA